MKAYHMTPNKNVAEILANGIIPGDRKSCKCFSYEDARVYLWLKLFAPAIDGTIGSMWDLKGHEDYTMLEIDCDAIDSSLFKRDECMNGKISVYTSEAIPASAIKSIGDALNFA